MAEEVGIRGFVFYMAFLTHPLIVCINMKYELRSRDETLTWKLRQDESRENAEAV